MDSRTKDINPCVMKGSKKRNKNNYTTEQTLRVTQIFLLNISGVEPAPCHAQFSLKGPIGNPCCRNSKSFKLKTQEFECLFKNTAQYSAQRATELKCN